MKKVLSFLYGVVCYLAFFAAILYLIGFVGDLVVPKAIDSGTESGAAQNLLINIALVSLFVVQHTIMLGIVIAFWATPLMTTGHLLFAVLTTAYILMGIQFEERDLVRFHGEDYVDYREHVSMLVPFLKKRS